MATMHQDYETVPAVRTGRIVVMCQIAAAMCLAGIGYYLQQNGQMPPAASAPILTVIALGLLPVHFVLSTIVPALTLRQRTYELAETGNTHIATWGPLYFTRTILGAALVEAGVLLVLTAYLIEGYPIALIAGLCAAVFLSAF